MDGGARTQARACLRSTRSSHESSRCTWLRCGPRSATEELCRSRRSRRSGARSRRRHAIAESKRARAPVRPSAGTLRKCARRSRGCCRLALPTSSRSGAWLCTPPSYFRSSAAIPRHLDRTHRYAELCLAEQPFVMDGDVTVQARHAPQPARSRPSHLPPSRQSLCCSCARRSRCRGRTAR